MAYLPTVEFGGGLTSASEIRNNWPRYTPKQKAALVTSMYPKTKSNPTLMTNVVKMLDVAIGSPMSSIKPKTAAIDRIKDNPLKEFINNARPLLREASVEKQHRFLSLVKHAIKNN